MLVENVRLAGLQDGRPVNVVHQSDAGDDEQTANSDTTTPLTIGIESCILPPPPLSLSWTALVSI